MQDPGVYFRSRFTFSKQTGTGIWCRKLDKAFSFFFSSLTFYWHFQHMCVHHFKIMDLSLCLSAFFFYKVLAKGGSTQKHVTLFKL